MNNRLINILWLGFEKFGLVLLSAISFFTFAIYLTPAQLGLAAIAIVFCELLTQFLSSALENPLVRRGASNHKELSSAFWFGGLFSVLLTLGVAGLYFLIDSKTIIWIMIVSLTPSVTASVMARPFIARLRYERQFKRLAVRTIWGKIIGATSAIIVAVNGGGEWSLVVQLVVMNTVSFIILIKSSTIFLTEKPSLHCAHSLFNEGTPIALRKLLNGLFERGIIIILAATTSPTTVGYFAFARRLVELPKQALDSAIVSYSLPVFSSRVSEKLGISGFFTQVSSLSMLLTVPLFIFYGVFGEQFIVDVFGEKWAPSTIYFIFFATIAGLQMVTIFVPPLQAAFSTSKIGFNAEIVKVAFSLTLAYFMSMEFGVIGAVGIIALDACLLITIRLYSVKMFLDVSLRRFVVSSLVVIISASMIGFACMHVIHVYEPNFIRLFLLGMSALCLYLISCKLILKLSLRSVYSFIKFQK